MGFSVSVSSDDIAAVAAVLTACVSFGGFLFIYIQVRHARRAIEAQAHAQIYQQEAEIQKLFLEHPLVRRILVQKLPVPEDEETYERVMTFCALIADFLEYLILKKEKLDRRIFDAFIIGGRYYFSKSPAYEKFFSVNRNNYSKDLVALYDSANQSRS